MGKLIVYTGPMKSGKTTKLIEKYKAKAGPRALMFKAGKDNRFSKNKVVARSKSEQIPAILINNLKYLLEFKNTCDNFFIDEFQFLTGDIGVIRRLLDEGKNVWVAGLNLTSERAPFGLMSDLMCLANKVYVLSGNCDYCGSRRGIYTLYDGAKDRAIVVGDTKYKCVCSKCYIKYKR